MKHPIQHTRVDPRRWLAFRANAASRYLLTIQAHIDDVRGAIAANQIESAVFSARITMLKSLSLLSLKTVEGEISEPYEIDEVSANPFRGVDAELVHTWLALARKGFSIDWHAQKWEWFRALEACVSETESAMGFVRRLEILRSPRGLSSVLTLANVWDPQLQRFGLPSALPSSWTKKSSPTA